MSVVAYVPDLMDRSKVSAAIAGVRFAASPDQLVTMTQDADVDVVAVDLSRPGVLEVIPRVQAARIVGFGSHVDRELLDAARAAGCTEVMARSAFFSRVASVLTTEVT